MSTPKYFESFPDIQYSLSLDKAGNPNYIDIKDYFHLAKVREDIFREDTLYYEYVIKDGQRPDQIAYQEYGDEKYYWIILQVNEIYDYYNQWPMNYNDLYNWTVDKYGSAEAANAVHHYETVETKDPEGNVVLPAGLQVPENFIYRYNIPDPTSADDELVTLSSLPVSVSNFQYEQKRNQEKESINLLDSKYIDDYVRQYRKFAKGLPRGVKSDINVSDYFR